MRDLERKMKAALVYKNLKANNPTISHVGLGVTAENIRLALDAINMGVEVLPVVDGYHLRRVLVQRPDITHVDLFAPWMDTNFMEHGLCRRFQHVQFALTCHSNVGFLQADRWAVKIIREGLQLQQRVHNFRVSGNCQKFCDWLREAYRQDALWLPNLYHLPDPVPPHRTMYSGGTLRVGIFGATRVQKNMMSAVGAALVLARKVRATHTEVWVSSGRVEGGQGVMASVAEMVRDLPHVTLHESGWLDWPGFRKLTGTMHLMFQPSYTESFNNVTADGISMGTPSVVSTAIDWVPKHWQACADNVVDIARVGGYLLFDLDATAEGYRALQHYNAAALSAWRAFLQ
jgi:hypothetical protein